MQCRIVVLAVLVTLAYWLGGAAGCASGGHDQNYKLLEEDRPMFDTRPDPDRPGELRIPSSPVNYIAAAPAPAESTEADLQSTQPAPGTPEQEDAHTPPAIRSAMLVPGIEPSVIGLDRSHWPVAVVTPAQGNTQENPIYFSDPESTGNTALDAMLQPAKFVWDLVTLPVDLVLTPPWTTTGEPAEPVEVLGPARN